MFWKSGEVIGARDPARWTMTTRLTLAYTISVFVLLSAISALLYWGLERSLLQADQDFLRHKCQVLTVILQQRPLNLAAVDQEVQEEAEISSDSRSPFFLRVIDGAGRIITQTPGMATLLPAAAFPPAGALATPGRRWHDARGGSFLLASTLMASAPGESQGWRVQAALDVASEEAIFIGYRRELAAALVAGSLAAAACGIWLTRRGLRPIAEITRATERIGVQQLQERIRTRPWPRELAALAGAFDRMLDRLQDSFERLSRFSADLAHELRTPINNLVGEAQVTLARERSAAEYARVLQSGLEEHARLSRMIDSMLFLARADQATSALQVQPLEAAAHLRTVAEFYQPLAEELAVTLSCAGDCELMADPALVRRALSNLLSNALRYTSAGGAVTLSAGQVRDGASVLRVTDTGAGIAPEHLPRLGDRFYRVDPSRSDGSGGAGLGLAIVRSIMALHRGELLIESEPGRGTAVSLVFPIMTDRSS
jgi:two-component system heavy metal sensor histidine kinase CusS